MRVNLKKAAALSAALTALGVKTDHTLSVDVYADIPTEDLVKRLDDKFKEQVQTVLNISAAAFMIRELISKANEGRINTLLSGRALIEKQLTFINTIPVRIAGTNLNTLARQIEAQRAAGAEGQARLGGRNGLILELATDSVVGPILRQLRRTKRDIDDELQALNFNNNIELPEDVVKILTDLDLI